MDENKLCTYCDKCWGLCHYSKSENMLNKCNRKGCPYYNSRDGKIKSIQTAKKTNEIQVIDWTKKVRYVHVYSGKSNCYLKKHKRTEYKAKCLDEVTGKEVMMRVFYCETCDKYYTNMNLLPDSDVMHAMGNVCFFGMPSSYYDYTWFGSTKSILAKNGYTVRENGISKEKRQFILESLIQQGTVTGYDVIDHLNSIIDLHRYDKKWQNAIRKYREDIEFVRNLGCQYSDAPHVLCGTSGKKYYI